MEDGIVFNQSKYIKEMLKKFGLEDSKPTKTPMSTEIQLTKDDEADSVDSSKYRGTRIETIVHADSNHVGDYIDRKSTSGVCTFIGCCLTSWFAKKQTTLAISMTEAEYISAGKACQEALWMKQALIDYDICLDDVPIMESYRTLEKVSWALICLFPERKNRYPSSLPKQQTGPSFLEFYDELSDSEDLTKS
ncbi:hypothetical protein Tco_1293537 [Tanacetum coccineum]